MMRITFREFLQNLLEGPKAVYCDLLVDKYFKYSAEFEEEEEKKDCTAFFSDAGVCAEFSEYTQSFGTIVFGAIFQIKNNCDYLPMLEFFQKKIQNIGKKQKVVSAEVFVYLNEKGITNELIETSTLACVPQQYRNKYWCYRVASGNIPSVKLAQSCGFQAIGGTVYFDLSKEIHL